MKLKKIRSYRDHTLKVVRYRNDIFGQYTHFMIKKMAQALTENCQRIVRSLFCLLLDLQLTYKKGGDTKLKERFSLNDRHERPFNILINHI